MEEENSKDLISVIIPVYNVEKYIKRCLNSICAQTYKRMEIILIDDGSTDGSEKICDYYTKVDSRIKVIHKNNSGVSEARNVGLKVAKGEYITFVDADDFVSKLYLEKMYILCKQNNCDISIIGTIEYDENIDKEYNSGKSLKRTLDKTKALEEMLNEKYYYGCVWGKLYKSKMWENIFFNKNTKIGEDLEVLYKVFLNSHKVNVNTKERLYYYTKNRNNSATKGGYNIFWEKEIEICENIVLDSLNRNKKIFGMALKRYIRINYSCIIKLLKSNKNEEGQYDKLRNNIYKYKKYNIYAKFSIKMKIKLFMVLNLKDFIKKLIK